MVRRCGDKMAKLLLVAFSGLFLVCGIALLVVGAIVLSISSSVDEILNDLHGLNIFAIVFGLIIVLVSILGIIGALRESSTMLRVFWVFLLLILVAEVAAVSSALTKRSSEQKTIKEVISESLNATRWTNEKHLKEAWDDIQKTFKCCGVDGYKDYGKLKLKIRDSCCTKRSTSNRACDESNLDLQTKGCYDYIAGVFAVTAISVGAAGIVAAFFAVTGIILAFFLQNAFGAHYQSI